jgi:large subunit ribosomal protein L30
MTGATGKTIKVKLVRSANNRPADQQATLEGLGLTRMNRQRELADTPAVRGMVRKVMHLIRIEE